jgi:hypothetical protein
MWSLGSDSVETNLAEAADVFSIKATKIGGLLPSYKPDDILVGPPPYEGNMILAPAGAPGWASSWTRRR